MKMFGTERESERERERERVVKRSSAKDKECTVCPLFGVRAGAAVGTSGVEGEGWRC